MSTRKWRHDVPHQRSPIYVGSVLMDAVPKHNAFYGRTLQNALYITTKTDSTRCCYSAADIEQGANALLHKADQNKTFVHRTETTFHEYAQKLLKEARRAVHLEQKSLVECIDLYSAIYTAYVRVLAISMMPELSIDALEDALDQEIQKQFPQKEELIRNRLSALPESFLNKEKKALQKADTDKKIRAHAQTYFWIENNYLDTPVLFASSFQERRKNLHIQNTSAYKEKHAFLSTLEDTRFVRLRRLVALIELLVKLQDGRKRVFMEVAHYLNRLLNEIGKRKGYTLQDMFLLFPKEIQCLEHDDVDPAILKARSHKVVFALHQGKLNIYEGETAEKKEEALAPLPNTQETLKGRPAYPGNITGKIRIITRPDQLPTLKENEILATSNTTPDYVPYLAKAQGILTEKGGITSHAAIISREMKKPCIVGIPHLTHILSTGDLVEMDANTGHIHKFSDQEADKKNKRNRGLSPS